MGNKSKFAGPYYNGILSLEEFVCQIIEIEKNFDYSMEDLKKEVYLN